MRHDSASFGTHAPVGSPERLVRPSLAVLGIALLIASGVKAYEWAVNSADPAADSTLPGWAWVPLVELELLLGFWFVSGIRIRAARWIGILVSFSLAGYSLYAAATGRESCGCFGRIVINPWWTFLFDVAILAALLSAVPASWPVDSSRSILGRFRRLVAYAALPAAVFALGVIGINLFLPENVEQSAAASPPALPPGITLDDRGVDMGLLAATEVGEASFTLHNAGPYEYKLQDIAPSCGCTVAKPDREVIAPGESCTINAGVDAAKVQKNPGLNTTPFVSSIQITLSSPALTTPVTISVPIRGQVQSNPQLVSVPGVAAFGRVVAGQPATARIVLRGPEPLLAAIPDEVRFELGGDNVLSLEPRSTDGAVVLEKEVSLALATDSLPLGRFEGQWMVDAPGPEPQRLVVRFSGELITPVTAAPSRLFFSDSLREIVLVCDSSVSGAGELEFVRAKTDLPLEFEPLGDAAFPEDSAPGATVSSAANGPAIAARGVPVDQTPAPPLLRVRVRLRADDIESQFTTGQIDLRFANPEYTLSLPAVISVSRPALVTGRLPQEDGSH